MATLLSTLLPTLMPTLGDLMPTLIGLREDLEHTLALTDGGLWCRAGKADLQDTSGMAGRWAGRDRNDCTHRSADTCTRGSATRGLFHFFTQRHSHLLLT